MPAEAMFILTVFHSGWYLDCGSGKEDTTGSRNPGLLRAPAFTSCGSSASPYIWATMSLKFPRGPPPTPHFNPTHLPQDFWEMEGTLKVPSLNCSILRVMKNELSSLHNRILCLHQEIQWSWSYTESCPVANSTHWFPTWFSPQVMPISG